MDIFTCWYRTPAPFPLGKYTPPLEHASGICEYAEAVLVWFIVPVAVENATCTQPLGSRMGMFVEKCVSLSQHPRFCIVGVSVGAASPSGDGLMPAANGATESHFCMSIPFPSEKYDMFPIEVTYPWLGMVLPNKVVMLVDVNVASRAVESKNEMTSPSRFRVE